MCYASETWIQKGNMDRHNTGSYEYERNMNNHYDYQRKHPTTERNHPLEDAHNKKVQEGKNEGKD